MRRLESSEKERKGMLWHGLAGEVDDILQKVSLWKKFCQPLFPVGDTPLRIQSLSRKGLIWHAGVIHPRVRVPCHSVSLKLRTLRGNSPKGNEGAIAEASGNGS